MFFWTTCVLSYIERYTSSRVVTQWYFHRTDQLRMYSDAAVSAFRRAISLHFGSIVLAALLLTVVKMAQYVVSLMQRVSLWPLFFISKRYSWLIPPVILSWVCFSAAVACWKVWFRALIASHLSIWLIPIKTLWPLQGCVAAFFVGIFYQLCSSVSPLVFLKCNLIHRSGNKINFNGKCDLSIGLIVRCNVQCFHQLHGYVHGVANRRYGQYHSLLHFTLRILRLTASDWFGVCVLYHWLGPRTMSFTASPRLVWCTKTCFIRQFPRHGSVRTVLVFNE